MDVEYRTVEVLRNGEEILEGRDSNHSMPDYSFSANSIYVIKKKGKFRAMRIYGKNHEPIVEIALHPEAKLNGGNKKDDVWHMHIYKPNLDRQPAEPLSEEIKEKYANLLEDIGYDKW